MPYDYMSELLYGWVWWWQVLYDSGAYIGALGQKGNAAKFSTAWQKKSQHDFVGGSKQLTAFN